MRIDVYPFREGALVPTKGSQGAAGFDIYAWTEEPVLLRPGNIKLIKTGICVRVPEGWEMQIRPRSGMALKYGITVLNGPGTLDAGYFCSPDENPEDYEVGVILVNHSNWDYLVNKGDRIAQGVFAQVPEINLCKSTNRWWFKDDDRKGGFGSTGR